MEIFLTITLTSFFFLFVGCGIAIYRLWQENKKNVESIKKVNLAILDYARQTGASLQELRQMLLGAGLGGMPFSMLTGSENESGCCSDGFCGAEGEPGVPDILQEQEPEDPDEDDDIGTLGELM